MYDDNRSDEVGLTFSCRKTTLAQSLPSSLVYGLCANLNLYIYLKRILTSNMKSLLFAYIFFLFRIEIESPKFSSNRRLIFALTFISVFVTFVSYCYILQTNMVHILYTFIVIFALTFINVFAKIPTYCYFVFQVNNMVYILHALILIFAHFHLLFSYTCISNE